jgi:hypothetical protein
MKYRRKPVVVEAFRWWGETVEGFERICVGRDELSDNRYNLVIPTLTGDLYAVEGDWIIKDVTGEYYLCSPDVFDATYEPV